MRHPTVTGVALWSFACGDDFADAVSEDEMNRLFDSNLSTRYATVLEAAMRS